MAYKKKVYVKAKEILQQRKQTAEKEQEIRHSQIAMKLPEVIEIEQEMASYAAKAVQSLGKGGDVQRYISELGRRNIIAQDKRSSILMNAGYPSDYLEVKYSCMLCNDTGTHDSYYCNCYKKLVKEVARGELEMHAPLAKSTFNTFCLEYYDDIVDKVLGISQKEHMRDVYEYCKAYAGDFSIKSKGIIMIGQTGLGKTHLSLAIANKVLEKGYDVYYDSIQNIMDKLEKEHFGKVSYDYSVKDDVLDAQLLIIDDLGVEFSTQFTVAQLHNIVNTRILKGYPTIISTNLGLKELESKYSPRIASRIIGSCIPVHFCGKDIRQRK